MSVINVGLLISQEGALARRLFESKDRNAGANS